MPLTASFQQVSWTSLQVEPKFMRPACRVATAAIDRFLLPAPALSSKPAGRRCCCRSTGQTDGWTDGQSFYDACCIPCAAANHVIGNESAVPKITVNNTINLFSKKLHSAFCQFQTVTVYDCFLMKFLQRILFEKYIYILASKMATGQGTCTVPAVSSHFHV